jgi:hypothetical protein
MAEADSDESVSMWRFFGSHFDRVPHVSFDLLCATLHTTHDTDERSIHARTHSMSRGRFGAKQQVNCRTT